MIIYNSLFRYLIQCCKSKKQLHIQEIYKQGEKKLDQLYNLKNIFLNINQLLYDVSQIKKKLYI